MIPVSEIFGLGRDIIKRVFPDKEAQQKAELVLAEMDRNGELAELSARSENIKAEAKSEHWLVAAWRPITMLSFVTIIVNNYILYPCLSLFWPDAPKLDIPPQMWELLKIGIGGYIVGRSVEKGVREWKK